MKGTVWVVTDTCKNSASYKGVMELATIESQTFETHTFHENLSFGITLGSERERSIFQFNEDRFRHTAIIGRTGSGKSNQLLQMEREDIRNGAGIAIIAAHEEDALYPLMCVPEERMGDVVLIDPTNTRLLPCVNPLDVDKRDRAAVSKTVSDCIGLLKCNCFHEYAGPRFDAMARLGIETMLDPGFPDEPYLGLLEKLFSDPDYIRTFVGELSDKRLYDQWMLEAKTRRSSDADDRVSWFLAKVAPFEGDRVLRSMFGPGKRTIDVKRIVDEGKILVAYIPEGRIGHEAASILCTWITGELKDAILSRGASSGGTYWGICGGSTERREPEPFFIYIDEFAEHASEDFADLLAEARKYRVGFVLAFQTLAQMRTFNLHTGYENDRLLSAVLGNVGTMICYPVGGSDVQVVAAQFNRDPDEIARIARYRPLAQVCWDNEPRICTLEVPEKPAGDNPKMPKWIAEEQIIRNIWLPTRK